MTCIPGAQGIAPHAVWAECGVMVSRKMPRSRSQALQGLIWINQCADVTAKQWVPLISGGSAHWAWPTTGCHSIMSAQARAYCC